MLSTIIVVILIATAITSIVIARKVSIPSSEVATSYEVRSARRTRGWLYTAAGVAALLQLLASTLVIVGPTEVGVPVTAGSVGEPVASGMSFKAH